MASSRGVRGRINEPGPGTVAVIWQTSSKVESRKFDASKTS
jgi:hypothetical protein